MAKSKDPLTAALATLERKRVALEKAKSEYAKAVRDLGLAFAGRT